ncbi:hypothetical protein V6N12_007446 [Hibiscus sabdariffa]|uniref:RNase H type-1 domain-containing protein n=1 Tax=Hibiscus sabdariffa TaxID=183260 RepID=A0ABR2F1T0_9ROSI
MVEIWSVNSILTHSWRLGIHKLELETDNVEVERILNSFSEALKDNVIVDEIQVLVTSPPVKALALVHQEQSLSSVG